MSAFDSSFDASFDTDEDVAVEVGVVTAVCLLAVSVVDLQVFESKFIRWSPVVNIGGTDVSGRLTGRISISAAEDAARIASLSLIPPNAAALAAYDNAPITIDVLLYRSGTAAAFRLFTGLVEGGEFAPDSRVASLECRDGYQERPKACATAAEVEALFGGLAFPSPLLLEWDATEPDPVSYFEGLLDTLPGAVAIDASGLWRVIPWAIPATPTASFGQDDIYDGSLTVIQANRADLPKQVTATLAHRIHRLHCWQIDVSWARVDRSRYVVDGLPNLPKATLQAALDGLSDWYVKGSPVMVQPTPGSYPVIVGPQTLYYLVDYPEAQLTVDSFSATLYRRWYQDVEVRYSIAFDMGGLSDRVDAVSATLSSDFDAGAWESPSPTASSNGLYSANEPFPVVTPTGFEALPEPHPPANGVVDHLGSHTSAQRLAALRHVVAKGLRQATAGKRKQRLRFGRPIDPRWELGAVLGLAAYGVSGIGQVDELGHDLDLDSGDASSEFTLAVPQGNSTVTGATVAMTAPTPSVVHAGAPIVLGNKIGAAFETPAWPDADQQVGFLCNVLPTSNNYDPSKPVFNTQFRIIMPEVSAAHRDPLTIETTVTGSYTIAGAGLTIDF